MPKPYEQLNTELNQLIPSIAVKVNIQKLCFLAGITTDRTDPPNKVLLSDYLSKFDTRFLTGQAKTIIEKIAGELRIELPAELPAPPIQRRSPTLEEAPQLHPRKGSIKAPMPAPAEADSEVKVQTYAVKQEGQIRKINITGTDGKEYFMIISRMTDPSTVNLFEGNSYETTVEANKDPILLTKVAKTTRTEDAVHQVMAQYSDSLQVAPPLHPRVVGAEAPKKPPLNLPVDYETKGPALPLKRDQLAEFKAKCPLADKVYLGEPSTGRGTIFQIHQNNGTVQNLLVITNREAHTIHVQGRAGKPILAMGDNQLKCVAEESQKLLQQQKPSASVAHDVTNARQGEVLHKGPTFG